MLLSYLIITMTTKTTKTILFASLVAAILIPISGMQIAHAEELSQKRSTDSSKEPMNYPSYLKMQEKNLQMVLRWKKESKDLKINSMQMLKN